MKRPDSSWGNDMGIAKWVLIVGVGAVAYSVATYEPKVADASRGAETAHNCLKGRLLSADGEAPAGSLGMPALNEAIRATMHDGTSYDHQVTQIFRRGQEVQGYKPSAQNSIAAVRFRGTNAFGAVVDSELVAEVDPSSCQVVEILALN